MNRESPPHVPQMLAYLLGVSTHLALFIFHRLRGYTSPGTDPSGDPQRAVAYNLHVVDEWCSQLTAYLGSSYSFEGRSVLELGPGPDPGAGMALMSRGCASYTAVDANPLFARAGDQFYAVMLEALGSDPALVREVTAFRADRPSTLEYRCLPDFDLRALNDRRYDLALSQAACEHFTCPRTTIFHLAPLLNPGGVVVFQIDLKTHTPIIRDIDPLSIYRISLPIYQATTYPGVPNRMRPYQYKLAFEAAGFEDVRVYPTALLPDEYVTRSLPSLDRQFRSKESEMNIISMFICARKF